MYVSLLRKELLTVGSTSPPHTHQKGFWRANKNMTVKSGLDSDVKAYLPGTTLIYVLFSPLDVMSHEEFSNNAQDKRTMALR